MNGRFRGALLAAAIGLGAAGASCQQAEQGYWTKYGVSQALTNQQFPTDSERCEHIAVQDEGGRSEAARLARYNKCMHARGYVWVVEEPLTHPVRRGEVSASHVESCPTGRRIVDAYGFPKCVPSGRMDRTVSPEIRGEIGREIESTPPDGMGNQAPLEVSPGEKDDFPWGTKDRLCRRLAQETLSSPYGVYTQCMQKEERQPVPGPW